ncbi:triose-phosphate isomerase [Neobacillus cucumis]|uniref:triose-phosphate isomerase n=1 Tax=Neobacillus cucumis TaxID=1740721 RepID=UPI0028531644|nr:triose-phosphate isomerase [Neobacillus cucumis]MDR4945066.1 triose-phosphate isomerase [Neobacillus cucumis]
MNKVYIGTNWKMHKSIQEGREYCRKLQEIAQGIDSRMQLFIIPPYTALTTLRTELDSNILLGAQNMHWEEEGPFTGEISPTMLKEIGIDLVELGHSERRQYYNENDVDLNKKVHAALDNEIIPLLCIGEKLEDKENGISEQSLSIQLKICLKDLTPAQAKNVLVAYEPVWAIGAGGTEAPAEYVHQMHNHIRKVLVELFGDTGSEMPILFGGSVNRGNAIDYLKGQNINGLFIGRSAWDLSLFEPILNDVEEFLSKSKS